MAYPDDLLKQAFHLANREPKHPRQAGLRRAISAAYYALFHLLIGEAVQNWRHAEDRSRLARMFEHRQMKQACRSKAEDLGKRLRTGTATAVDRDLLTIADTFVQLQQQRETADYDLTDSLSRTDALNKVQAAKNAFNRWRAIRKRPEAQQFLLSLLLRERR